MGGRQCCEDVCWAGGIFDGLDYCVDSLEGAVARKPAATLQSISSPHPTPVITTTAGWSGVGPDYFSTAAPTDRCFPRRDCTRLTHQSSYSGPTSPSLSRQPSKWWSRRPPPPPPLPTWSFGFTTRMPAHGFCPREAAAGRFGRRRRERWWCGLLHAICHNGRYDTPPSTLHSLMLSLSNFFPFHFPRFLPSSTLLTFSSQSALPHRRVSCSSPLTCPSTLANLIPVPPLLVQLSLHFYLACPPTPFFPRTRPALLYTLPPPLPTPQELNPTTTTSSSSLSFFFWSSHLAIATGLLPRWPFVDLAPDAPSNV